MDKTGKTKNKEFWERLVTEMENKQKISLGDIFLMFPETNPKTLTWRLYKLVQQGKLFRAGRGNYSTKSLKEHLATGYEYLQKKSQDVYNVVSEYGYEFYITGLDSLTGELLHMPEQFTVLLAADEAGMEELREALSDKGYLVVLENEKKLIRQNVLRNKLDIVILKSSNFELASGSIAIKEKGFVDLYFAVTRLNYEISIPEWSRIFENMHRNETLTTYRMKQAAKDRGISAEINWLLSLGDLKPRVLEFMRYQIMEVQ